MRYPGSAWMVLPIALVGIGCVSRASGTRAQFAQDATCPEDRVTVRDLSVLPPVQRTPPADVAADPQALAIWRVQNAEDAQRRREQRDKRYQLAEGCGQSRVYDCVYCIDEVSFETTCSTAPACARRFDCRESQGHPGYVTCDGDLP